MLLNQQFSQTYLRNICIFDKLKTKTYLYIIDVKFLYQYFEIEVTKTTSNTGLIYYQTWQEND